MTYGPNLWAEIANMNQMTIILYMHSDDDTKLINSSIVRRHKRVFTSSEDHMVLLRLIESVFRILRSHSTERCRI
jgi:hypothetical protein